MMTFEDFKANIELYSGDLSRWPQGLIRDAARLAETDPAAKALLDAHVSFDMVMRRYTVAAPRLQALEDRIMQQVAKTSQGPEVPLAGPKQPWRPAWLFAPGGGLLAAALLGFLVGFYPQQQKDTLLDPSYYSESQVLASNDAATDATDTDDGGVF